MGRLCVICKKKLTCQIHQHPARHLKSRGTIFAAYRFFSFVDILTFSYLLILHVSPLPNLPSHATSTTVKCKSCTARCRLHRENTAQHGMCHSQPHGALLLILIQQLNEMYWQFQQINTKIIETLTPTLTPPTPSNGMVLIVLSFTGILVYGIFAIYSAQHSIINADVSFFI